MTREELRKRYEDLSNWAKEAQEKIDKLTEEEKKYISSLVEELSRKNSKRLANLITSEICEFLEMRSPLDFCVEWKWDGFFGIGFVLSRTIYALKI